MLADHLEAWPSSPWSGEGGLPQGKTTLCLDFSSQDSPYRHSGQEYTLSKSEACSKEKSNAEYFIPAWPLAKQNTFTQDIFINSDL